MAEVILFADAAAAVCDYLREELVARGDTATTVTSRVPNPRTSSMVVVRRVGGVRSTLVTDAATLAIDSWADNEADAHDLAQLCRGLLHAQPNTHGIVFVDEFSGPGNFPDTQSDQPRFTQTVSVHIRGGAEPSGS